MEIISGTALSKEIKANLALEVNTMTAQFGRPPKIALLLVGEDPSSASYVRSKAKTCAELGIASDHRQLPADISQEALLAIVEELNGDSTIDAILVQLPLPEHLDTKKILHTIDYQKDVDGLHPMNVGQLLNPVPGILPCTPRGIISLLKYGKIDISGKHAVVLGRSRLVGNPAAQLLLRENASVTTCHSKSTQLAEIVGQADILVSAMGNPDVITPDMLKEGVVVIDVAMNYVDDKLAGDIYQSRHLSALEAKVAAITPVPGGVGPMTITSLMQNTVEMYQKNCLKAI
jgi:methylenetetrahydrofolate dehydrogenase (NADP+)/methenyltetrahydrofolate cyclohydrolase